jgi:hypothetical protein
MARAESLGPRQGDKEKEGTDEYGWAVIEGEDDGDGEDLTQDEIIIGKPIGS